MDIFRSRLTWALSCMLVLLITLYLSDHSAFASNDIVDQDAVTLSKIEDLSLKVSTAIKITDSRNIPDILSYIESKAYSEKGDVALIWDKGDGYPKFAAGFFDLMLTEDPIQIIEKSRRILNLLYGDIFVDSLVLKKVRNLEWKPSLNTENMTQKKITELRYGMNISGYDVVVADVQIKVVTSGSMGRIESVDARILERKESWNGVDAICETQEILKKNEWLSYYNTTLTYKPVWKRLFSHGPVELVYYASWMDFRQPATLNTVYFDALTCKLLQSNSTFTEYSTSGTWTIDDTTAGSGIWKPETRLQEQVQLHWENILDSNNSWNAPDYASHFVANTNKDGYFSSSTLTPTSTIYSLRECGYVTNNGTLVACGMMTDFFVEDGHGDTCRNGSTMLPSWNKNIAYGTAVSHDFNYTVSNSPEKHELASNNLFQHALHKAMYYDFHGMSMPVHFKFTVHDNFCYNICEGSWIGSRGDLDAYGRPWAHIEMLDNSYTNARWYFETLMTLSHEFGHMLGGHNESMAFDPSNPPDADTQNHFMIMHGLADVYKWVDLYTPFVYMMNRIEQTNTPITYPRYHASTATTDDMPPAVYHKSCNATPDCNNTNYVCQNNLCEINVACATNAQCQAVDQAFTCNTNSSKCIWSATQGYDFMLQLFVRLAGVLGPQGVSQVMFGSNTGDWDSYKSSIFGSTNSIASACFNNIENEFSGFLSLDWRYYLEKYFRQISKISRDNGRMKDDLPDGPFSAPVLSPIGLTTLYTATYPPDDDNYDPAPGENSSQGYSLYINSDNRSGSGINAQDLDAFRFFGIGGKTYRVEIESSDNNLDLNLSGYVGENMFCTYYNDNCNGLTTNPCLEFTPASSNWFGMIVSNTMNYPDRSGYYSIKVRMVGDDYGDTAANSWPLAIDYQLDTSTSNATVPAEINSQGDVDWFKFRLPSAAGSLYTWVDVTQVGANLNAKISNCDSSGANCTSADANGLGVSETVQINFWQPSAQWRTIKVEGVNNTTGTYKVRVVISSNSNKLITSSWKYDESSPDSPISWDTLNVPVYAATLHSGDVGDAFTLSVNRGDRIAVDAVMLSGAIDPVILLYVDETGSFDPVPGVAGSGYWFYDYDKDGGFKANESHLEHIVQVTGTMKIIIKNENSTNDHGRYYLMVRKLSDSLKYDMPKQIGEVYSGYN